MAEPTLFWALTALVWCVLLAVAAYLWQAGERRRAVIALLGGLIGGGPSILGHLL